LSAADGAEDASGAEPPTIVNRRIISPPTVFLAADSFLLERGL